MEKVEINILPIKLSTVEKAIERVKKEANEEDLDLSFEFILSSFFPTCWNNIQSELSRQYTLGYIAGTKDAENNYYDTEDDADCYCE